MTSLLELRRDFYGGSVKSEQEFLALAKSRGVTAASLLNTTEIDYKENLTNVASPAAPGGAGTSYTVIPGTAIAVPVQVVPWYLTWGGFLLSSLAGSSLILAVFKDGAVYRTLSSPVTTTANGNNSNSKRVRVPANVSGTFELRVGVTNSATGAVVTAFGTIEPTWIQAARS